MDNEAGNNTLRGKKFLIISNGGYAKEMIEEIKDMGGTVYFFNDKPKNGFTDKVLGRLKIGLYVKFILEKYYERELKKLCSENIDTILVIRGEYTPINSICCMREVFPAARIVLYMWDSIVNNKGIKKTWPYYDDVWTFDRKDYLHEKAEFPQLKFMPLFFCEKTIEGLKDKLNEWDLSFVGTGHGDRVSIAKEVKKQCDEKGVSFFCYIYVPHILVYFVNKLTNKYYRNVRLKDVHFKALPLSQAYDIYNKSKCILDVESITQSGLTMRTIEVIGAQKKLITTNPDIIHYNFFDENNIYLVDRSHVVIDEHFIDGDYKTIDPSIYEQYSLRRWLISLLAN